jgi:hypothetical protein
MRAGRWRHHGWQRLGARAATLAVCAVGALGAGCAARMAATERAPSAAQTQAEAEAEAEAQRPIQGGAGRRPGDVGAGEEHGGQGDGLPARGGDAQEVARARVAQAKGQVEALAASLWGARQGVDWASDPTSKAEASPPARPPTQGASGDGGAGPSPAPALGAPTAEDATGAGDADGPCCQPCEAAAGICTSQATICEVAAAYPLDPSFAADCAWAAQVCQRAQRQCGACRGTP